jgi:hypothetical protein
MSMDGRILTLLTLAGLGAARAAAGSRGVVRRGRTTDALDPVEGEFVTLQIPTVTALVGPTRFARASLSKAYIALSDRDRIHLVEAAMKQEQEGYLRTPGTAIRAATNQPRSQKPREVGIALATRGQGKFRGWKVVVFCVVGNTDDRAAGLETLAETARLGPGGLYLFPLTNEALRAEQAEKEAARTWLIDVLDRAWGKVYPNAPGSRGVVRKGRAPTPHDPLAERFFEKAGYSHPPEASEAQILQIRRRHGRDLANAWRAFQDDASIDARWNVEENPDTSWMDAETLEAYQSGNMEILSLTFNRLDADGYPTETLDHLGEISLLTKDRRENRWDRELFEAEMALGLGLGQEPE